jgi:hypothetical protein
MSCGLWPVRGAALAMAVMLGACRGRTPPNPTVDWKPGAGARAETAALLVLDRDGMARLVCLPERAQERQIFPRVAVSRILDVAWKGGPILAGWLEPSADASDGSDNELGLMEPQGRVRRLAKGVRAARFSPYGEALVYEVAQPWDGGAELDMGTSYVLDRATGKTTEVGPFVDPRWESDGQHLRATRLRSAAEKRQGMHWSSLRVRWDRESATVTAVGPGSAQIPAAAGAAVAWSEEPRGGAAPSDCAVHLGRRGGPSHTTVGAFCAGLADDRGVRWSPNGRWLAFPHPGPVPGEVQPGGFFIDVVGVEGGRYPALSALFERARRDQIAIATTPGTVWFDWSPSGRFLAMHDGASDLRVYDFETRGIAFLGKGQRPMWSPGSAYLLFLTAAGAGCDAGGSIMEAVVLPGVAPAAKIQLGPVRDVRWLPAQACDKSST